MNFKLLLAISFWMISKQNGSTEAILYVRKGLVYRTLENSSSVKTMEKQERIQNSQHSLIGH